MLSSKGSRREPHDLSMTHMSSARFGVADEWIPEPSLSGVGESVTASLAACGGGEPIKTYIKSISELQGGPHLLLSAREAESIITLFYQKPRSP